jgi:hypothetical protein
MTYSRMADPFTMERATVESGADTGAGGLEGAGGGLDGGGLTDGGGMRANEATTAARAMD